MNSLEFNKLLHENYYNSLPEFQEEIARKEQIRLELEKDIKRIRLEDERKIQKRLYVVSIQNKAKAYLKFLDLYRLKKYLRYAILKRLITSMDTKKYYHPTIDYNKEYSIANYR